MLPTSEITRELKISRSTLFRWARLGLIPRPTTGMHGSGNGRTSWWSDEAAKLARQIVFWTRRGHPHDKAVKKPIPEGYD